MCVLILHNVTIENGSSLDLLWMTSWHSYACIIWLYIRIWVTCTLFYAPSVFHCCLQEYSVWTGLCITNCSINPFNKWDTAYYWTHVFYAVIHTHVYTAWAVIHHNRTCYYVFLASGTDTLMPCTCTQSCVTFTSYIRMQLIVCMLTS